MGTKRKLTPRIRSLVDTCQPGPFLDAFAGMCSVGSEIGPSRPVWSNDFQAFSNLVATALFCSRKWPPSREEASLALMENYQANFRKLAMLHGQRLERESRALDALDHCELHLLFEESLTADTYPMPSSEQPYDLFTQRYSCTYFSVAQAMELDSIRYAVDAALRDQLIGMDEQRWLLLAMATGMNRCTTSTGHFAQPLAPKAGNISRVAKQRGRSVLSATLDALADLRPIGSARWRNRNKVFSGGAIDLLRSFGTALGKPAVIYADPPYTDDQYSRYYHLYETLVLYDYPICTGRGRYRGDRAVSDFCLPTKVYDAVNRLIEGAANLGADIVLSYPDEGLLKDSQSTLRELFGRHYGRSPEVLEITHFHSSMGASKGIAAAVPVIERLYRMAA